MSDAVPPSWHSLPLLAQPEQQHPRSPRPEVIPEAVCRMIRERHARRDDRIPPSPAPGSELAQDDAAVEPYLVSGAIETGIAQALDHLEAVREIIEDRQRLHPWAQYTLMRAALESASTAVWLVAPNDAQDRRFRLIRLAARDLMESESAQKLHGLTAPSGRTFEERRAELRDLAPRSRQSEVFARPVSYRRVVRAAAPVVGLDEDLLELIWRVLSGLAHGAQWASIGMLTRTVTDSDREGVANVRFTGSTDSLILIARSVLLLTDYAERRRSARGTSA